MMIIDPPSPFATLSEWARFRREMERVVAANPGDMEAREALENARNIEASKRA